MARIVYKEREGLLLRYGLATVATVSLSLLLLVTAAGVIVAFTGVSVISGNHIVIIFGLIIAAVLGFFAMLLKSKMSFKIAKQLGLEVDGRDPSD